METATVRITQIQIIQMDTITATASLIQMDMGSLIRMVTAMINMGILFHHR